jgi:hypothetical protein
MHRADITHLAIPRSGYSQLGEYQLTTLEFGLPVYGTFRFDYATRFLEPVYIQEVDGVPLFKLWKNDKEHVKKEFNLEDIIKVKPEKIVVENNTMIVILPDIYNLQRIDYKFPEECYKDFTNITPSISSDGENYRQLTDTMNNFTMEERLPFFEISKQTYSYFFAGDPIRSIVHVLPAETICDFNDVTLGVYAFEHLKLY